MWTKLREKLNCSVGITAHNEEANMAQILQAVLDQRLHFVDITEIIVVASGCTDRTIEIVQEFMAQEPADSIAYSRKAGGQNQRGQYFSGTCQRGDLCFGKWRYRTP